MKLYTEEQVTKLTTAAFEAGKNHNIFIFGVEFEKITPIELPSDEEIREKSLGFSDRHAERASFRYGSKYVIDKIQGGNE